LDHTAVDSCTVHAVPHSVEVSGLPDPNQSRRRHARTRSHLSLSRVPIETRARRDDDDAEADRCSVADGYDSTEVRSQTMTTRVPPLPPCPRCRQLTGVEEDDNTGSSLR